MVRHIGNPVQRSEYEFHYCIGSRVSATYLCNDGYTKVSIVALIYF